MVVGELRTANATVEKLALRKITLSPIFIILKKIKLAQLSTTCEWHNQHNIHMKKHDEIHFLKQAAFLSFARNSSALTS